MTVNKRKKVTKYRGLTTHGGGHRKKRRGAGNRGGRGRAGHGKRGCHKKQSFEPLGRHGFIPRRQSRKNQAINISDLSYLIKKHHIEKTGDIYFLDLTSLGYQKLLSTGQTRLKLQIKVAQFSPQAEEKIKAAGGLILSENSSPEGKEESE